jgi:DNA-binding MarR family transcriptional regulator
MTKKATQKQTKAELIEALMLAFRQDQNRTQAFDETAAHRLGINITDLRCLDIVQQHRRITAGGLADAAHLTTGAVTAVLDRLERIGYARRVRDDADRRRVMVELTPEFERAAWEIWGPVGQEFQAVLERYTAEELGVVLDMLRRGAEVHDRIHARLKAEAD